MSQSATPAYTEVSDLQALLESGQETPKLPPGITIRPANAANDEAMIAQVSNAAFGFGPLEKVTAGDVAGYVQHPGATREGIFLAFNGQVAVGLAMGRVDVPAPGGEPHRGAVELLAIRPGYRRRGIGRALIHCVFRWLAEQGVRRVGAMAESADIVEILCRYGFRPAPLPMT